jgi:predicted histone-like DNA-binding protein
MAVHIRLIKNNIKRSSSYGKYFAKTVSQGEVTLRDLAAEACRNSGFSEGAVIGVVTELQDMLKHRLSEGQTVVIDGIGRFSLRAESIGVDDPKTFNIRRHIKRIVCGFLPAGSRTLSHHISYDFTDGVKAVWQHGCKP